MSNDASVYVWGCYAIGVALPAIELALLCVRARLIRQHLGWGRRYGGAAPPRTAGTAAAGAHGDDNGPSADLQPRPRPAAGARQPPGQAEPG